jgi:hypothetical protein
MKEGSSTVLSMMSSAKVLSNFKFDSYIFNTDLFYGRKTRIDDRTRQDQVLRRNEAFALQLEGMTDSYLSWFDSLGEEGLANNCPVPPTAPIQAQYQIGVVDVFCGSNSFFKLHFLVTVFS